ncbi:MAG TPA: hypothetical protein DCS43_13240 [Verrucomicrobia bacterium]|nr:hypothetical protein [Verrucomicrobiota bacterium]
MKRMMVAVFASVVMVAACQGAAKTPLKVFILAGQSNMEGHAQVSTFAVIPKDPKTAELYKEMVDDQGKPVVCDNVWISYAYGDFGGNPVGRKAGKLTAGWGSQHHVGSGKIGPEFTFGITMNKMLGEPILLIKNAWGGKSLMVDFRPPSAGALPETASEQDKANAGKYYALTMAHVKEVLADPKRVYPGYDPEAGYEVAGFVWFQGFNDMVGNYPLVDPAKGRKSIKDYSEYSRLLACFIRDVRKDLQAPGMPFVTGVLGVDGDKTGEGGMAFRSAMAAPAEMVEFKGNVVNVFTGSYWPAELDAVLAKAAPSKNEMNAKSKAIDAQKLPAAEMKEAKAKLNLEYRANLEKALTEDELFLLDNGISNQGFHYLGSAKFFGQIGKAFAEVLMGIKE